MIVVPARVQHYYYCTPAGAEIDLILEFSHAEKWAIEIKRSTSPSLSKGFHIACDDIKPERRYVVYSGIARFSLGEGIVAISLAGMMEEIIGEK